jgi:hypothetical protein
MILKFFEKLVNDYKERVMVTQFVSVGSTGHQPTNLINVWIIQTQHHSSLAGQIPGGLGKPFGRVDQTGSQMLPAVWQLLAVVVVGV